MVMCMGRVEDDDDVARTKESGVGGSRGCPFLVGATIVTLKTSD